MLAALDNGEWDLPQELIIERRKKQESDVNGKLWQSYSIKRVHDRGLHAIKEGKAHEGFEAK
jgi:hypothetical protein